MKNEHIEPIRQYPIPPNEWLTKLDTPNVEDSRMFTDWAIIPTGQPLWYECTNEYKEQWDREHPQPEPETINQ